MSVVVAPPSIQWVGSPNYRAQSGLTPLFYVIHWMVGNLAGTDRAFQNAGGVSTNYGIEEGVCHQYVKAGDYAFGTGNTYANSRGISVEHAGGWLMPDGSRYSPNRATLETSARLLAWLSQTFGWGRLALGVNVFVHRDFVATECPGTTDVAYIIARANQLRDGITPTGEKEQMDGYRYMWDGTRYALVSPVHIPGGYKVSTSAADGANYSILTGGAPQKWSPAQLDAELAFARQLHLEAMSLRASVSIGDVTIPADPKVTEALAELTAAVKKLPTAEQNAVAFFAEQKKAGN